jgi:SAM-dependent methyltransferase
MELKQNQPLPGPDLAPPGPFRGADPGPANRACGPELLDSLPFGHPDAVHCRRDLRLINLFMRNVAWFERTLPALLRPGERVLEIGAGTGELGLRLCRRGVALDGLDLWPRPEAWPKARRWHVADLRGFSGYDQYAAVIGNLIFHQFSDSELGELGATLRRSARLVVACEPTRRRLSQRVMALLAPLAGANHVTRHDAQVSIAAGFAGEELPAALGMEAGAWEFSCTETALGASRMVAVRSP